MIQKINHVEVNAEGTVIVSKENCPLLEEQMDKNQIYTKTNGEQICCCVLKDKENFTCNSFKNSVYGTDADDNTLCYVMFEEMKVGETRQMGNKLVECKIGDHCELCCFNGSCNDVKCIAEHREDKEDVYYEEIK